MDTWELVARNTSATLREALNTKHSLMVALNAKHPVFFSNLSKTHAKADIKLMRHAFDICSRIMDFQSLLRKRMNPNDKLSMKRLLKMSKQAMKRMKKQGLPRKGVEYIVSPTSQR